MGRVGALPKGFWLGVALDEAVGRNNGTVKGEALFACDENHGAVGRPSAFMVVEEEGKEGKAGGEEEL